MPALYGEATEVCTVRLNGYEPGLPTVARSGPVVGGG